MPRLPRSKGKVYYVALPTAPPAQAMQAAHFFSIDTQLVYWNFFLDFGPLNLGQLYRFCQMLNSKLQNQELANMKIYYFSGTHPHRRTNAAFMICAWAILYMNKSPEEAYRPFENIYPAFTPFHDATPVTCTYHLTVFDCLCGLAKAKYHNFFNFETFDVDEYEHFEQVENGDLNWIQEGRFVAFAGPHESREMTPDGYRTLTVEDYAPYFRKKGVDLVVRTRRIPCIISLP